LPGPYTVAQAKTAVLVANTVEQVLFTDSVYEVEIKNHDSTVAIYVRFGNPASDPTVEGDNCTMVGPGERVRRVLLHTPIRDVRLISTGAAKFTVEATR
jgi:hypothetical protein